MSENRLGELVKKAKGDDRTAKQYAEDSLVDAAVISKMILGKYVPQRQKIYKDLTSDDAAPRGGVTFEQMWDAAQNAKPKKMATDTLEVVRAILHGIPLAVLGSETKAAILQEEKEFKTSRKKACNESKFGIRIVVDEETPKREMATALGILYGHMAQRGIQFFPKGRFEGGQPENVFDTCMEIRNKQIEEYVFSYLYLSEQDREFDLVIDNACRRIIERWLYVKPDSRRKVSIIVLDEEEYNYLLQFKGRLSYKGDLSIILLDAKKVCVTREDYLAHFYEGAVEEWKIV